MHITSDFPNISDFLIKVLDYMLKFNKEMNQGGIFIFQPDRILINLKLL